MIKTIEDANEVIYEEKVNKLLSQEYKILFANYTGGKWIAIMENNEIIFDAESFKKGETAVYCDNEEEVSDFVKELKELDLDFEWNNLFNYCYWYKNNNIYGQYNDYKKCNHKLVKWSDCMGGTYH